MGTRVGVPVVFVVGAFLLADEFFVEDFGELDHRGDFFPEFSYETCGVLRCERFAARGGRDVLLRCAKDL
jgi:hypothetical protein